MRNLKWDFGEEEEQEHLKMNWFNVSKCINNTQIAKSTALNYSKVLQNLQKPAKEWNRAK
jgi:hypothetical protein